jgi:hypothetical protein
MTREKEVVPVPATGVVPKAVRLDLSPDLHAELRVESAKLGKPMAVVVRDLVVAFLAERRKKGGRAK